MVVCQGGSVVLAPTQEADVVLLLRLDHPRTSLSKKGNEERAGTNDKSPVEHGAWALICSRSVKREEARDGIRRSARSATTAGGGNSWRTRAAT
jgi:hypothetical protein